MTNLTTSEFYLACWLKINNVPLVGHIREDNKSTFQFQGENVNDLTNEFYSETVMVPLNRLIKIVRELKALMYSGTTIQPNNNNERIQCS